MPRPMPRIMYGTAWKNERTTDLVYQALKAGFRGIDTACQPKHYREDLVGKGIQKAIQEGIVRRDELFIQTKYTSIDGQDQNQPLPYDPRSSITEQVKSSFQKSLSNLGVDHIDSVVLHSPLSTKEKTLEAYQALEAFVDNGQLSTLGVSNIYDPKLLEWLIGQARIRVGVVQNRWYEGNGFDWPIYDICQKHSIRYQSFWTLTGSPHLLRQPILQTILDRSGLSTREQVLYKLCLGWNITPLCGTTNQQHMEEAVAIEDAGELSTSSEAQALLKAMR